MWNKIKSYSREQLEFRKLLAYIDEISFKSTFVYSYKPVYKIQFYNFLKSIKKNYNISPNDVLCFIIRHPRFISDIYRSSFKKLEHMLLNYIKQEDKKIISFVTLYYDNYNQYQSVFRALLKTVHYPLDKFDLNFLKKVFNTYPFLTDKKHLKNVLDKIKEKGYAYYVTQNGIKEVYE